MHTMLLPLLHDLTSPSVYLRTADLTSGLCTGILHFFVKPFLPLPVSAHEEEHKEHLMSDHLFLAASITAVLTTETILGLGDLLRTLREPRTDRFRLSCLSVGELTDDNIFT